MRDASLDQRAPSPASDDRLDSWKQIALYLKRDVTTVQRWEKREGMPVHRHLHDSIGSVYASRAELDAWTKSRNFPVGQTNTVNATVASVAPSAQEPAVTGRGIGRRFLWPAATGLLVCLIFFGIWLQRTEAFWKSPIANARIQPLTDFAGLVQGAAVSRDGHFVAFLSDRAGPVDVWLTQVGSGEFHNLTHGSVQGLVNPSLRNLAFSPDGSLVTFWVSKPIGSGSDIGVWAVPVLGGEPRPYFQGVAEFDWSRDGARLAYHTPGPGDPLFLSNHGVLPESRSIFTANAGVHNHFPLWAPDGAFLYFVHGTLPDKLDIWRIAANGGEPERITMHNGRVSYPVLLNKRQLLYLASNADRSGPWVYSVDVERRIPHRLTSDLNRYTSLAASADGQRLVATVATPKRSLWRMRTGDAQPKEISMTTGAGFSPRLGPNYLLYASQTEKAASIWKLADGRTSELWRGEEAKVIGGPVISGDGRSIAFSIQQGGESLLCLMQADGTNPRVAVRTLRLEGAPAWSPDGRWILSAADDHGVPNLFRVTLNGGNPGTFVREYSTDPVWSPDGRFILYSGPDIGTRFSVKAVTADGSAHSLAAHLTLTRGSRHLVFFSGGHELIFLRGNIQHKDLWAVNLDTGAERPFAHLPFDFDVADFDVSADGHEIVLERLQEISNVVLLDLAQR